MPRNHSKELMSSSSSPLMLSPSFLLSSSSPPSAPHLTHTLSSQSSPFTHLLTDTLSASSMAAEDCDDSNSNSSNLMKDERTEYLSCVNDEDGEDKSDDVLSKAARGIDQRNDGKESDENFDVTGYFHWTPSRRLTDCLLDRRKNQDVCDKLANHVVLCLSHHSQCSLRSFLLPLRTSSLKGENLKAVVIVAKERSFVEREWAHICHFPAVYVKIGSPLNRGVLRSVRIERCHMCVVHSAQRNSTLLHSSMLTSQQSLPLSPPPTSSSSLATHDDSKALLITLNIKNMSFKNVELKYSGTGYDILRRFIRATKNSSISVKDENVQFIDQDDEDDPDTPFHLTQPFACGRAFASRVLDALSITIIFNPETYDLFRVFVTGTDSEEHDHLMAEGFTEQSCQMSAEQLKTIRNRPRLNLLPVNTGILKDLSEDTFGHLFTKSLSVHGILCLGLYRLVNVYARSTSDPNNRFVITNPSPGMKLHFTDKVYCICTQPTADC
ncbi:hypothetical protein HELRODRAFT_170313 [Helobdella robusta]|uniref:Calcium-activated potassium channel BK alpha subunit domain-containing protein n=1 Tax=Helobdella robusta TaxID=6412 RepID=T1F2W9_HELRO|nr:hypothetical protein HELRODRAFT_170313 [Helobdella robusta]ESO07763.1 hypothetical protein HELRODRAFT_170313 [Helobdella robusta]